MNFLDQNMAKPPRDYLKMDHRDAGVFPLSMLVDLIETLGEGFYAKYMAVWLQILYLK